MFTINTYKGGYIEAACLHTDTKPTEEISTGSICVEVDTGDVYFFDADSEEWVKQFSFQD